MSTELITLEIFFLLFFYHQSNAGLIMHSMQELTRQGNGLTEDCHT